MQAARRDELTDLAVTAEEQLNYNTGATTAAATLRQQEAQLSRAKLNLERTEFHSPVRGWVTNLQLQRGDCSTTGARSLSVVDADSFWVGGYFEEMVVKPIHVGSSARVWLTGAADVIRSRVESIARGINVANETATVRVSRVSIPCLHECVSRSGSRCGCTSISCLRTCCS